MTPPSPTALPLSAHGARLTIDLAALRANWRLLAERAVARETAAVVKADGYGLGIEVVVPALAAAGARTFFVAHLSEAVRARRVAPEATIYVLNGLPPGAAPLYAADKLRPVLGSAEEVVEWRDAFPAGAPAAVHVDTGMNRLGLRPEGIGDLLATFRPSLLMTHFVASEEPDNPLNTRQAEALRWAASLNQATPTSLCNSSGIFLADQIQNQAVARPGYALYGGNPTPGRPNPMRAVVHLEASVVQVSQVKAGETVGYNAQWTARGDRLIATLSTGYADGYLRAGSASDVRPGAVAIVNGVECPFAGRVSMDLITVDVTAAGPVKRGDRATLIGDALPIDRVAGMLGTNGYEVLTGLGGRYERVVVG